MLSILKNVRVAVVFAVAALVPAVVQAQVSTFTADVKEKEPYTITASLAEFPAPGELGEFTGTVVLEGTLPPATDNFRGTLGRLQGVSFTRLADDTIKIVDANLNEFWVILRSGNDTIRASITDGSDILAKGEFRGVWFNDTGEAGAQSIPVVLASLVAQQSVAANEPAKPSLNECLTAAIAACRTNGGLKKFDWSSAGTCSFECLGFVAP